MFKKKNNINSKFYLTEKKFKNKPKFVTLELLKILKKNKDYKTKKDLVFLDIGCANGALIDFISNKIQSWNFVGTEIENDFVNLCKKNIKNCSFYLDNLKNKPNKNLPLGDILYLSGVHSHFDDPKVYLDGAIRRCKKKGIIIIHGLFNPYKVDLVIRYKKSEDYNLQTRKVDQTGWNMFSIESISKILNKNNSVSKFKFKKLVFPTTLKVKFNNDNHIRSWNKRIDKKNFFVNGLNLVQHQYFLIINKK